MSGSPLDFFRTYQKTLLAVFGVLLMVGFLIGGVVTQSGDLTTGIDDGNNLVVKLDGGDLYESDLQQFRFARNAVRTFMRSVAMIAAQKGATPQQSLGVPDTDDEENLVQTAVLAKQAKDLGIEVTDEAIIRYLENYSQATLERGEFARILQTATQGRVPQSQFFDAMRRELLALRYLSLFQQGMYTPTPEAAWEYYLRLNRKITFEAVPFPVADYLSKVGQPSDADIARLYEEGKKRYPLPDRPEPGFRRFKKVAVEYVKADLAAYMPQAKAEISDAEVAEYYEKNKESFRRIALPDSSSFPSIPELDGGSTADPAGAPSAVPNGDGSVPGAEAPAAPAAGSGELPIELPATPPAEPATGQPSSELPLQDDPAETGPQPNEAPVGDLPTGEPAADIPPEATTEADAPAAVVTNAEPSTATENQAPPADASDTTAAEPTAEPTTDVPAPGETASEPPAADDVPLPDLPEAAGNNVPLASEYKSLEEVADEIRTRLATPIARQRMDEAINTMRTQMRGYYGAFIAWDRSPEKAAKPQPTAPDMRALAQENGLTFGTVPKVDVFQLQETDAVTGDPLYEISTAYEFTPNMQQIPFAQQAFDDDLGRYQARSIDGAQVDTEYLFWKTDEEADRVPELTEIRDEVIRAWQMREALTLAKAAAQEAAAELQKSGTRPEEKYRNDPNRKVLRADAITWMTSANVPGYPPMLTRVPGVRYAGPEFMKSVFSLNPQEAGVAVDNPETTAYAVFVVSDDSDEAQLRAAFFRSGPSIDTLILTRQDGQVRLQQWYANLTKQLGMSWERDPRRDSRGQ